MTPCSKGEQPAGSAKAGSSTRPITEEATSKPRRTRPWDWLPCDWTRPITKEATSKTRRTRPWDWLPCDWMRLVTREATSKTRRTQPWDWLKTRRTQPWPSPLVENPPPFTSSTILPSHGALATGQLGTRRAASWQHRPLGPPFHCLPCKVSGLRE
jgi:hypothetical protein